MLVAGPPDLQQLALVVLFIPATSTNTLPALCGGYPLQLGDQSSCFCIVL